MRLLGLLSVGTCFLLAMGCASSAGDSSNASSADLTTNDGSHFVHCRDDMTQLTFEKNATEFTLKVREEAYKGQTLGLILDSTLAPGFFHTATGDYIELTVHVPLDNVGCTFSATRDTLFSCSGPYPMPTTPPVATITDGVSSATLDDTSAEYATEFRHVVDVLREQDETVLHLELFGPSHPAPTGYIREQAFAPELCTTTRP